MTDFEKWLEDRIFETRDICSDTGEIGHMMEYLIDKKIPFEIILDDYKMFDDTIQDIYKYLEDKINE